MLEINRFIPNLHPLFSVFLCIFNYTFSKVKSDSTWNQVSDTLDERCQLKVEMFQVLRASLDHSTAL